MYYLGKSHLQNPNSQRRQAINMASVGSLKDSVMIYIAVRAANICHHLNYQELLIFWNHSFFQRAFSRLQEN